MAEENQISTGNFRLFLNGSEFEKDLFSAVEGVTVEDEINLPAMFNIRFNIIDFLDGSWMGIDLDTIKLGDEIKVLMGMDQTEEMLTGEITSLEPTFGSTSKMEIRGYDRLYRLRFGTLRRSFQDIKDSEIASNIASEIGLSTKIEDTETIYPNIFQNNQSNYQLLLERAQRIDFELFVDDKDFIFRKSQEDKAPEVTLQYGIELENFAVQLKTLTEGSEVEVRGWDIYKKEEIVSTAASGSEKSTMKGDESGYKLSENAFGGSQVSVVKDVIIDSVDAENIAKAKYNLMLKQFITGEGICGGNPKIRAGKTMEIKGLGDRFSGVYYIYSTVHVYNNEDGYKTKFKVRRTGA